MAKRSRTLFTCLLLFPTWTLLPTCLSKLDTHMEITLTGKLLQTAALSFQSAMQHPPFLLSCVQQMPQLSA